MTAFMLAIAIISLIIFLIALFILWIEYPTFYTDYPKIKFEAFKKFYSINPDRWELKEDYVACKIDNDKQKYPYGGLFYIYETEKFHFGFFDWLKYLDFCKELKANKQNIKNMRATSEMIKMVKKDIANMEVLGQQQQKQAKDNIESILNNLGGTKC